MSRTLTARRYVKRYRCSSSAFPGCLRSAGTGTPRRAKCAHCGSALITLEGLWGVFVWTPSGRYPVDAALSLHTREDSAGGQATARGANTHTTRWVPREDVEWLDRHTPADSSALPTSL